MHVTVLNALVVQPECFNSWLQSDALHSLRDFSHIILWLIIKSLYVLL